jgi:pimeloyl-ACP methyl ester carboxylesterase
MPRAAVNGVELYYEVAGEGFPIVFSHEFAGDHRSWEPQVRFFARRYRCVTYNHRGYPPSSAPDDPQAYAQDLLIADLKALLEHLSIGQAHLVGLSMGANVVLNFALRHPDLCRSIVVAGCGTGSTNRERFEAETRRSIELVQTQGMGALVAVYRERPTRQTYARKDPRGFAELLAHMAEHSATATAHIMRGVQLARPSIFALKTQLNALRVPTLLVVGDADEPCLEPSLFMRREIGPSALLVVPRTGHVVNLEEPALFNQALSDFFHAVEVGRWP